MRDLLVYFAKLGTIGFGGPIALVAKMHADLVADRKILDNAQYQEGLSFSQLAPGPLAAQLASYIGWLRGGAWGALAVGAAFVVPSFLMVLLLAYLYAAYEGLPWLAHVFYGVGAAVIGIIAKSSYQLTRKTLGTDAGLWLLFAINALATVAASAEMVTVLVASGALYAFARTRRWHATAAGFVPAWDAAAITTVVTDGASLASIFWFFTKASLLVFGSGLAIVPFLYGETVEVQRWLTEREFLDAIAVSMITPGPVVITVAFIGFIVAGLPGALAAALGIFLPVWLSVVVLAPYYRRLQGNEVVHHFVAGITAAVTGALAGAVCVLAFRTITDATAMVIAVGTLVIISKPMKIPEPVSIMIAALVGLLLQG